jgi:hypothetical protein
MIEQNLETGYDLLLPSVLPTHHAGSDSHYIRQCNLYRPIWNSLVIDCVRVGRVA